MPQVIPDRWSERAGLQAIPERHVLGRLREVVQLDILAGPDQLHRHAQQRRDADPARQKNEALTFRCDREMIPRRTDREHIALLEVGVHEQRPAPGLRIALHADEVVVLLVRRAQRVLPHLATPDVDIDVCAGFVLR